MNNPRYTRIAAYVANIALVVLVVALLKPSAGLFGAYYCLSFWTLCALDFSRSSYGSDPRFVDRFLGYLFAAPFILIARGAELVPVRARS